MRESATAVGANRWAAWPVFWTPVLVGALAAIVAVALFGVIGTAIGASKAGAEGRITTFSGIGLGALAYAVFASFLAFVIGGWITARVGGITWAEPAMASFGGAVYSGWYAALAPSPAVPAAPGQPVDPNAAKAAAAGATAAAAAILLGLAGSVVGGWMGSGEPMNLTHYKTRGTTVGSRPVTSDRTTRI